MPRKVFLSFTGTLIRMREGEVSDEDLENGLFYFGCARVHAMEKDPSEIRELQIVFAPDPEEGLKAYSRLRQALLKAEAEGRVAWRPLDGDNTQEQLNELLETNGAEPLNPNLPPVYEYGFIATAIDRVNNKDGRLALEPVY